MTFGKIVRIELHNIGTAVIVIVTGIGITVVVIGIAKVVIGPEDGRIRRGIDVEGHILCGIAVVILDAELT